MQKMKYPKHNIFKTLILCGIIALTVLGAVAAKQSGSMKVDNLRVVRDNSQILVRADINMDSLQLPTNRSLIVTPVIDGPNGEQLALPSLLVNGRDMHFAYERGTMNREVIKNYSILDEVRRNNGKPQTYSYSAETAMQPWMLATNATIRLVYDSCGCGHASGRCIGKPEEMALNPAPKMRLVQITPEVTELPVSIHEGKARVQFELDKTELHVDPYRCKNGQRLDNREQIAVIVDSINYALSDPNVEIARIEITGYASPESPYVHNDYLATNRSRALVEYLADRYKLPAEAAVYSAVPENWVEFRQQVVDAKDITEQQRQDLLELIDAPTYGPADYDAKEKTLKTDPRFAKLYASKILPEWFPHLRATKFAISTRLRPLSDEKLAEVIHETPQLLSLNQMMRVARLYPEGSDKFNEIIEIALEYYKDDEVANLNAAVASMSKGDYTRAAELLKKAGDSPEAWNARGVLACYNGDFAEAEADFAKAGQLPEAIKNLNLLRE